MFDEKRKIPRRRRASDFSLTNLRSAFFDLLCALLASVVK